MGNSYPLAYVVTYLCFDKERETAAGRNRTLFFLTGDVIYRFQKKTSTGWIEFFIFKLLSTEVLTNFIGTLDSTDFWTDSTDFLIKDDIIKMISTALLRCFFTLVRLFVLILKYNFFTHGLQMPEEHLFFLKRTSLLLMSTSKCALKLQS
jgi:hypothetical protein